MPRKLSKPKHRLKLPPLDKEQIFVWAKAHFRRTGYWPAVYSGPVVDAEGDTWESINKALYSGGRGLPGGSSLSLFLDERHVERARRPTLPNLTIEQILDWAEAHFKKHGRWPLSKSGLIPGAPRRETWQKVAVALLHGNRGLSGRTSLARLLFKKKGAKREGLRPRLTERQILEWIDAYYKKYRDWPRRQSGPIPGSPGDTWQSVDGALRMGARGLTKKMSLFRFLQKHRQAYPDVNWLPHLISPSNRLTIEMIMKWAKAHRQKTGRLPNHLSGPISGVRGATWNNVDSALRRGSRGLPGGSSLARVFGRNEHRRQE